MFGSAENYIALRLLGESSENSVSVVAKGRKWILDHSGAVGVSSWGKFWLTVYLPTQGRLNFYLFIFFMRNRYQNLRNHYNKIRNMFIIS